MGRDVQTLIDATGPLPPGAGHRHRHPGGLRAGRRARVRPGPPRRQARQHAAGRGRGSGQPDHVYLSDFGLSKQSLSASGLTGTASSSAPWTTSRRSRSRAGRSTGAPTSTRWPARPSRCWPGQPPFRRDEGLAILWAQLSATPAAGHQHAAGTARGRQRGLLRRWPRRPPTGTTAAWSSPPRCGGLRHPAGPGLGPRHPARPGAAADRAGHADHPAGQPGARHPAARRGRAARPPPPARPASCRPRSAGTTRRQARPRQARWPARRPPGPGPSPARPAPSRQAPDTPRARPGRAARPPRRPRPSARPARSPGPPRAG